MISTEMIAGIRRPKLAASGVIVAGLFLAALISGCGIVKSLEPDAVTEIGAGAEGKFEGEADGTASVLSLGLAMEKAGSYEIVIASEQFYQGYNLGLVRLVDGETGTDYQGVTGASYCEEYGLFKTENSVVTEVLDTWYASNIRFVTTKNQRITLVMELPVGFSGPYKITVRTAED